MLGGCFWPVEVMPSFMQKISYAVPQRWVLSAIEKVQHGNGINDTLLNFIILLLFACIFFAIAAVGFNTNKNVQKFI